MCLATPVRVIKIKNSETAIAQAGGVKKDISIRLLKSVERGDYVLLHAGFAIQKIDEKEAALTLKALKELAEACRY